MSHFCHAHGCNRPVPPSMFMCKGHWYSLPKPIRDAIWREYKHGQEETKTPSLRYCAVQRFAVSTLAAREGKNLEAAEFFTEAREWAQRAIAARFGNPLEGLVDEIWVRSLPGEQ